MTKLKKLRREVRSHSLHSPLVVELTARTTEDGAILTMWEKRCRKKYSVSIVDLYFRLIENEVKRNYKER